LGFAEYLIAKTSSSNQSTLGSGTELAQVIAIMEEGQITLGDHSQLYQVMTVKVLQGDYTGQQFRLPMAKTKSGRITPALLWR